MNVGELLTILTEIKSDTEVKLVWDGEARTCVRNAYISKGGDCILVGSGEVVYEDYNRPLESPTKDEEPYWHTE